MERLRLPFVFTLLTSLFNAFMAVAQPIPLCHSIPATSTTGDTVVFTTVGGSFASYGCAPIDPTYWLSGSQVSITATFVQPENHPQIRVWGMNSDDVAAVSVNGAAYPLDNSSATLTPKVVCGLSPGPDGVVFSGGYVTGANSPADGNFSYQDIMLNVDGISSILVTGLTGAGWGFAGVLVDCSTAITDISLDRQALFPNPTTGPVRLPIRTMRAVDVLIMNELGSTMRQLRTQDADLDISDLPSGVYTILILQDQLRITQRIVKI